MYSDFRGDEANSPRNELGLSDIYDDTRYDDGLENKAEEMLNSNVDGKEKKRLSHSELVTCP